MRVLHIVSDMGQGGAQSYVCDLVKCQMENPSVFPEVVLLFFKGPKFETLKKTGVPINFAEMFHALDLFGLFRFFLLLNRKKYDVIHMHAIHPGVSAILGLSKAKKVFTEHGGGILGGSWKDKFTYRLFHKIYDAFIAISRMMSDVMVGEQKKIADKTHVIYNGVNVETIDSLPAEKTTDIIQVDTKEIVGVIGRLTEQKDISSFLETAAVIKKSRKDLWFIIIGDGPLRGDLENQAAELGIQNVTCFVGYREDAIRLLKSFDVFLFTSAFEPFGLVITEAMASGVPVVALHQKGAVPEILDNYEDGIFISYRNYEKLAEAVIEVLENEALRNRIIENAKKKVSDCFSIQANAQKVYSLYVRLCNE